MIHINRNRCGILVCLFSLVSILSCASDSGKIDPGEDKTVLDASYYRDKYDYDNSMTVLGRGINLGNFFEAPFTEEYPLGEGSWNGGFVATRADFDNIRAQGFKTVRIPVRWSDHASATGPDYLIDNAFLARIKDVVDWARAEDLVVVLNTHHYIEMMDDGSEGALAYHRVRLQAIWHQICAAFPVAVYPADVLIFELLNEPYGEVTAAVWNEMIAELTAVIWSANAATQSGRKIMIGTANWGGVPGLYNLELPESCTAENTIITVHYYEPFHFTHQGAEWVTGSDDWIGTAWRGTASDQAFLLNLFGDIEEWNALRGYEIFVGEFGVYTKYSNPFDQKAWTAFVAREAEKRRMSWAYWEYLAGFGAYDPVAMQWRAPLLDALVPAAERE